MPAVLNVSEVMCAYARALSLCYAQCTVEHKYQISDSFYILTPDSCSFQELNPTKNIIRGTLVFSRLCDFCCKVKSCNHNCPFHFPPFALMV